MTSSSADRESRSGTDSVGSGVSGVTGATGVTGVTEEVQVGRTSTFGCSGCPERTAINASRRSCVCRCCSASCFWRSEISFRYPRISGWLSGSVANRLGLAEQGTLPAKDWISLSQSVETVELHVWLAGKLLASALVNLVPQLSDGVN